MVLLRTIVVIVVISLVCAELNANEDPSTEELFSETPCELRSMSAYLDGQKNLWGIGEGNIWWFNSTNLSWSLLPLPNTSGLAEPWKVTCGDPRRYVSLQGSTRTLILHLPWQHWQPVDADDVDGGTVDSDSTWCVSGILYATDSAKSNIYRLDHEEARWASIYDAASSENYNETVFDGTLNATKRAWILPESQLVLAEQHGECSHILSANLSDIGWTLLKKKEKSESWPDLRSEFLSWSEDGNLWLMEVGDKKSLWNFNSNELQWKDYSAVKSDYVPDTTDILTTWMEEGKICFLIRTEKCNAQYSSSTSKCMSSSEMKLRSLTSAPTAIAAAATSTESLLMTKPASINHTSASAAVGTNIPPPQGSSSTGSTPRAIFIAAHTVINKHSLLSALQSELDRPEADEEMPITAAIPARHNPWHQHTSVFGSVIFFGTSLSIFGLVGTIWCMRRCVYFPKEALLLRDPPSVRYTAIPDNVPYDPRSHPTTAYTVIPDSIA